MNVPIDKLHRIRNNANHLSEQAQRITGQLANLSVQLDVLVLEVFEALDDAVTREPAAELTDDALEALGAMRTSAAEHGYRV